MLIATIDKVLATYNRIKGPFDWSATAVSILEKVQVRCGHLMGVTDKRGFQIGRRTSEAARGLVQRCNVAARISSEPLSDNLALMCLR